MRGTSGVARLSGLAWPGLVWPGLDCRGCAASGRRPACVRVRLVLLDRISKSVALLVWGCIFGGFADDGVCLATDEKVRSFWAWARAKNGGDFSIFHGGPN